MTIPRRVATVCIGIAKYPPDALRSEERPLEFASSSAVDLHQLFKQLWPSSDSYHLLFLNENATWPLISAAVGDLSKESCDLFVFYFAGHGRLKDSEFVLLAYPDESGFGEIESAQIDKLVAKSGSQNILVLLDACHSGRFLEDSEFLRSPIHPVRVCFASSKENQRSWEDGFCERTLFADALVNALTTPNTSPEEPKPASLFGDLFPFVTDHVVRHAYALKSGAIQEPVIGGVSSLPILIPRAPRPAGRSLSTIQVLLRRTRQILTVVATMVLLGVLFTFLSTWRPALNEAGFLELRYGPKWLSPLNVGAWRTRVETGLSKEDLQDVAEAPGVVANLQNEGGTYPWPGRDSSGLRRWADVVFSNWVRSSVALRWRLRLDMHGVTGDLRGENAKLIPEGNATEYAAEYSLLRRDQPPLDTWKYQWKQNAFGVTCEAKQITGRTAELAELYVGLTPDDQTANWLRGLALTATFDDQVGFDRVIDLVETFKAMRLSWEKDYRSTLASETEPLSPARIARVFSERPSRAETDALADLAETIVVRHLRAGQPALKDQEHSALLSDVKGCGDWVVPVIARLGPFGDPKSVGQWARSKSAGDQARNSLLALTKYDLLDSSTIEWLLDIQGFSGDDFDKKRALTNSGEWLSNVAQNQALPKNVVDQLLVFAEAAVRRGELDHAVKALDPVSWNVRYLDSDQQRNLVKLLGSFHQTSKVMGADEVKIRGILQLGGLSEPETFTWGLLDDIGKADDQDIPTITFTHDDITTAKRQSELLSGWHLNDLIAISRIVLGLPKQTLQYRNMAMLRFLEHGCREGIRAGVSRQRLGPVFKAIADLRRQFLPLDFEARGIRRGLSKARDDYAQRQLAVEIVLTGLGNIEYGKRISIMNGLRREWMDEREPEVKYALATIMIECERRQRLSDADLQLKFRVSH
jgi:Caspase domain